MVALSDNWRMTYHLMPPTGWMNDPNGLCQMNGIYHVFFQYSPNDPRGGNKCWGHYQSSDLVEWEYTGIAMLPDKPFDKDGVYSGSAIVNDDVLHIFYTGNVKEPGDFDYITAGRRADTIHAICVNGSTIMKKEVVIPTEAYPNEYSCHVRDPKVWKEEETFYMVLGGRTKSNIGQVLVYDSQNLTDWNYVTSISSEEPFGYMWECPAVIRLCGREYLSVSPQGVEREEYKHQNIYISGYYAMDEKARDGGQVSEFHQWDEGFDFYAPQTFEDENGRTLLIGWMGLPDIDKEYTNPTVDRHWQHCLTMMREIKEGSNGRLIQQPVAEYTILRKEKRILHTGVQEELSSCGELLLDNPSGDTFSVAVGKEMEMKYDKDKGVFSLAFYGEMGAGRTCRKFHLNNCSHLQVFFDHSAVELYVNHGANVMSSRFYPHETKLNAAITGKMETAVYYSFAEQSLIHY